jgi:hypothetical protein
MRKTKINKAPIILFTYDRPDHAKKTIEALLKNPQVDEHDLIIYSDAARSQERESAVKRVRTYLKTISGFHSVTINLRPYNFGLARSIIEGVTQVLLEYESIIVLEDDMVTSPYFLAYMNEALDRFESDDRVISIHGYCYPVNQPLPEAFFLRGADCWGWATWRRGWALFNPDGQTLLSELTRRKLLRNFDFNGAYKYSEMLKSQVKGSNDSWAIRWYASAFLANKLTLYPGRSLVQNIGNDGSGTHCAVNPTHDAEISQKPIDLTLVNVEQSEMALLAFEDFYRRNYYGLKAKIKGRIKKFFNRGFVCLR